jgi:hypothetical protein
MENLEALTDTVARGFNELAARLQNSPFPELLRASLAIYSAYLTTGRFPLNESLIDRAISDAKALIAKVEATTDADNRAQAIAKEAENGGA